MLEGGGVPCGKEKKEGNVQTGVLGDGTLPDMVAWRTDESMESRRKSLAQAIGMNRLGSHLGGLACTQ